MDNQPQILKNPFGLNIAVPKKTLQEIKKTVEKEVREISVNPFSEYFEENDKVFSGEVAQEIHKYNAQIYALGQIMREDEPKRTFSAEM